MLDNYRELKAAGILLLGLGIVASLSAVAATQRQSIIWPVLISYTFLAIALMHLEAKVKYAWLKKIMNGFTFPASVIYAALLLFLPFVVLLVNWLLFFFFAYSIPGFLLMVFQKLHWIDFRPEFVTYLSLTVTVFICVVLNKPLNSLVNLFTTSRHKKSSKLKALELDKISNYTLSVDNVRFCIYAIYVVLLFFSNFHTWQQKNGDTDKIILQSFVTFIAFDRALTLVKQLKFRPSELLEKIVQSLQNKFKQDEVGENAITNHENDPVKDELTSTPN